MINILHTESSMNMGGQELRVLAEMEGLAGRGYRSALAARPGSRILAEAQSRGLDAYPVNMRASLDPLAVAGIVRLIRRLGIRIVNAHGSKDGWSAGIAARLTGISVVRSRHVANPIRRNVFSRMVYGPLCDLVVTTSESIREGMVKRGVDPAKVVSVPTGVDTEAFNSNVPRGRFRAELGVDGNTPLVGMVSVLRGDKGPDVFIKAASEVLGEDPAPLFVLAGDGWMKERLAGMSAASGHGDRIILAGYRRDVPSVLADLDVMVLPAKVPEGVPQAILQAHAMKVPVIASEVGGILEAAMPGITSVGVPPGDHHALAVAIKGLLADKERAAGLAECGHRLVMERYTMDAMLDNMDDIYRSILAGA